MVGSAIDRWGQRAWGQALKKPRYRCVGFEIWDMRYLSDSSVSSGCESRAQRKGLVGNILWESSTERWPLVLVSSCDCFVWRTPWVGREVRTLVAQTVKNMPAMQERQEMLNSIPGSGRSPREGHGNPLQYPCLENPMDRGAWWATVHGVAKSWRRLNDYAHIQYLQMKSFTEVAATDSCLGICRQVIKLGKRDVK